MNYFLELLLKQARIQLAEQIVGGALITVGAWLALGWQFAIIAAGIVVVWRPA